MAPSPQVCKAFQAMAAIGLSEQQVKPVLKNLLKLYNKDWSLIEAEEYRALADAIFEAEDAKVFYIYIIFLPFVRHSISILVYYCFYVLIFFFC